MIIRRLCSESPRIPPENRGVSKLRNFEICGCGQPAERRNYAGCGGFAYSRYAVPFRVRVLFFGVLRDLLGSSGEDAFLPEGATLADLLATYSRKAPELRAHIPSLALSLNHEFASPSTGLKEGDEIGFLPPVSGGAAGVGQPVMSRWLLTGDRLSPNALVQALAQPEDGAVVVFEGVVRNHSRQRQTFFLEYEAYEAMAAAGLQLLVEQAREKFPIRDAAVHHRLGRIEIGETSVVIAVFSAHRAAAFDACRWIIDTLKRTVPIWKKEHFEDGAVWADGEPFPASLTAGGAPGSAE
ncbi:MAG: molybdenum cofactor biosynthesis protein MoaE [Acidobacteria bacterium]|nr:molybdenum cofactor biosynthesis protein MoaE [Acidobacteriota bacterium]